MSDLRQAIEAAVTEDENRTEDESNVVDVSTVEVPDADPGTDAPDTPAASDAAPADGAPDPAAPPVADPGTPAAPDTAAQQLDAPVVDPKDPVAKAPGSWTPGAREHWDTLPPDVKTEVWKREREASRALTASTEARRLQQEFSNTMQPFLGFIAAERSTPLQAVQYMMQTAATLRVGTPMQKVQVVAETIRNFGIDLQALDSVLAGQKPSLDPAQLVQQEVQRALAPFQQREQQQVQQFQQQQVSEANSALEAFIADPKNEFYNDVAPLMADLMEVAARNGQQMGLTQAYERATLMHEPVRRVIDARAQREAANKASLAARQARGAASSVTPSASAAQVISPPGDNLRADIEAAFAQTQGR